MRLWILFGCGVLVLAGALWPFGKRTEQLGTVPSTPAVAAQTPTEAPKANPAPLLEVIDLARAYEPVREIEEPAGQVNPASFIEQPKRIPPALGLNEPYRIGASFWHFDINPHEVLDVMPREVTPIQNGLLNFVPTPRASGELVFTPMGVPYATGITQPIPPNASIQDGLLNFVPTLPDPVERLKIMPRHIMSADELELIKKLYGARWSFTISQVPESAFSNVRRPLYVRVDGPRRP